MTNVLLVIHLVLCLGLIILVLIQRSEGGALSGLGGGGASGGGMGGLMTGRSASSLLTRATGLLAGGFMLTSLILSLLANADRNNTSILDTETTAPAAQEQPAAPKADKPTEPGAPLAK
ncbi:Preprotein translocase subunit SecG [Candidatus Terasakiella magnetica]|uniref:Protein-export membrane protein SecG n=1 Tax=Candidatus Terasakiella magnetica TaxID=1867952 RepID=A0A1C3RCQ3_9PROT|nr:preprotein translocase subunit SecG [Candidatus Terasakiella magnetica]SCA55055.1 Preprotein translocase subunit SecG [Candidatus Terasakiella magnetica]